MLESFPDLQEFLEDRWVLIIDPSMNYRDSIRRFLTNLRVKRVKAVASAEDAKRELITLKVGFFISEWVLPGENGIELCRSIRSRKSHSKTPFLLITAEDLRKDVMLAGESGIDSYLLKPFAYEEFYTQVKELIMAARKPSQTNVFIDLADEALKNDRLDHAEDLYNKVLEEKPDSARALCGLGRIAMAREAIEEAIKLFEESITINPAFVEAYSLLTDVYERENMIPKLVDAAEKANFISPDNPRYTLILARGYFEMGKLDESEKFFQQTLRLSPKLAEAYRGLGNVFMEKKEFDKAIKTFRKALDLAPGDIAILNSLGMSYVNKGFLVQGIDHYRLALKIDANNYQVLFNIAFASEKLGQLSEAMQYYERAIACKPDFQKAKRRLKILRKQGRLAV